MDFFELGCACLVWVFGFFGTTVPVFLVALHMLCWTTKG